MRNAIETVNSKDIATHKYQILQQIYTGIFLSA